LELPQTQSCRVLILCKVIPYDLSNYQMSGSFNRESRFVAYGTEVHRQRKSAYAIVAQERKIMANGAEHQSLELAKALRGT
jgi:hypothetical protein